MSGNSKFLKSCTLYNIGSIYIKLENFAKLGFLFLTLWISYFYPIIERTSTQPF